MTKKLNLVLASVISLALISGCKALVTAPIPLPDRPEFTQIVDSDLDCVTDDTYEALAQRTLELENHIKVLEAVILSTHEK